MTTDLGRLNSECERLRDLMHDAPMNQLRTDADGYRWIGTHSMAFADRSSEWIAACDKRDAFLRQMEASK
jgi:hypothetical protein